MYEMEGILGTKLNTFMLKSSIVFWDEWSGPRKRENPPKKKKEKKKKEKEKEKGRIESKKITSGFFFFFFCFFSDKCNPSPFLLKRRLNE
jgi:hypothetical protein